MNKDFITPHPPSPLLPRKRGEGGVQFPSPHLCGRGERGEGQFVLLWLIVLLFSACAPAQTPPNLAATPGESVVVTRNRYQNDLFSVAYPTGWRVITSPAGSPPSVTFVAPGDCLLIEVSSTPLDQAPTAPACGQPDIRTDQRMVQSISIAGSAPAAEWDGFAAAFDQIAASLKDNS
jgi:hypothetical protein